MVDGIRSTGSARTAPASPVTPTGGPQAAPPRVEVRVMVDQVGWKATAPLARTSVSTVSTTPIRVAETPPVAASTDIAQTAGLTQQLAAEPPVDAERVARIKAAIAAGKFPILPSTIADRLLAFKLEWNGNEQA